MIFILGLSLPLISCSQQKGDSPMPALFESKIEAEKAAKKFGCKGAHKMGNKWMPCEKHGDHEKPNKHSVHEHHHHH